MKGGAHKRLLRGPLHVGIVSRDDIDLWMVKQRAFLAPDLHTSMAYIYTSRGHVTMDNTLNTIRWRVLLLILMVMTRFILASKEKLALHPEIDETLKAKHRQH